METIRCLVLIALAAITAASPPAQRGDVKFDYELLLNKCKGKSCRTETAARGEAVVSLAEEDPTFYSGYTPIEVHAGSLAFQLRFDISQVTTRNKVERKLQIGFSGRVGTLTGKQLTWNEKGFSGKNWGDFKMKSISGTPYSEGGETVTPTLRILEVQAPTPN
jgi:hypothetical protein